MKKFKNISIILLALVITSCSGFLDEELKTQQNTDYFNTQEGLVALSVAMYNTFRFHYGFEWSVSTSQYGTDEFGVGSDNSNQVWNDYTSNLSSDIIRVNINTTRINDIWDNMYIGIKDANMILSKADEIIQDENVRKRIKGEAAFVRGFNYLKLVRQYGGVPLKLEPSEGLERYFVRATAGDCMAQVIKDLEAAYADLPDNPSAPGRLYKTVAAHFLAKAHLFRASEINDSWNSSFKSADLAACITYADAVIARHTLAPNFRDLWAFTQPDGANESLSEIIFAAQFTSNPASYGSSDFDGNRMHLYFTSIYQDRTGFTRDIAGGREYSRTRTSEYMFDVFDMENDSRFWKSFRTKQNLNSSSALPNLTVDGLSYSIGELGLIYIINKQGDTRFSMNDPRPNSRYTGVNYVHPDLGKNVPHAYVRYLNDGTKHLASANGLRYYPSLNKYLDGSRPSFNEENGRRDGIIARVADTYLVKAEALIRQQKYTDAIDVINIVRRRAQFKDGEDRGAYTDGGAAYANNSSGQTAMASGQVGVPGALINSHSNRNSYYESLLIDVTTDATDLTNYTVSKLPAVDEAIIATLGYTGDYDRMMCFLLNERSRELVGEFHRWEDLARTKTLIARVKAYNTITEAANNITEKHYLRPIPQIFLDAIYNEDGRALTNEEKAAMQNAGY